MDLLLIGGLIGLGLAITLMLLSRLKHNNAVVESPDQLEIAQSDEPRMDWWVEYTVVYSRTAADSSINPGLVYKLENATEAEFKAGWEANCQAMFEQCGSTRRLVSFGIYGQYVLPEKNRGINLNWSWSLFGESRGEFQEAN